MPAVFTTTVRNEEKELVLQREHAPQLEETSEEATTTSGRVRGTRRKVRPRTRPSTTTTTSVETTTRAVVRRRRPQKPSTTEAPTTTSSASPPRRRFRQKLEPQGSIKSYVSEVPPNHKREYVPVTEITKTNLQSLQSSEDINKSTWKKLFDRIALITPQEDDLSDTDDNPNQEDNSKKEEVEVFQEIKNPSMKHGGNYRHIDDPVQEDSQRSVLIRNRFALKRRPFVIRSTEASTRVDREEIEDTLEPVVEQPETPFKPKIIKDPSKRRYFYAKLK